MTGVLLGALVGLVFAVGLAARLDRGARMSRDDAEMMVLGLVLLLVLVGAIVGGVTWQALQ